MFVSQIQSLAHLGLGSPPVLRQPSRALQHQQVTILRALQLVKIRQDCDGSLFCSVQPLSRSSATNPS